MGNSSIRIAVLHFSHETVTFLKNDTTLDDFIYPGSPASGEALLKFDSKGYMGGFVKMAREFDGVELTRIILREPNMSLPARGVNFGPCFAPCVYGGRSTPSRHRRRGRNHGALKRAFAPSASREPVLQSCACL